ncbi:MAG: sporulation protein YqfD [Ruminococcus sp.]|nr:sporulation protein YqfD [Ruminococcus sp.]
MLVGMVRWCKGYVAFTAFGKFPERLLNLAAVRGIRLWQPSPLADGLQGYMSLSDYRRIRPLAKKARVRCRVKKRRGLPFLLRRYRGRGGLLFGAALGAILLIVLSQFLWSYRIIGAEHLSESRIRDALAAHGVTVGSYRGHLDVEPIERALLSELDNITWVSINLLGCTADVEVHEKAQKPDIQSLEPCNIKAAADGVITRINIREGFVAVKEGSGVAKGELLISGLNPTKQGGVRYMHADADVYADVISHRELKIPKRFDYDSLSENKTERRRLRLLWIEMPFSLSFTRYDHSAMSVREENLTLNGTALPLGVRTETAWQLCRHEAVTDETTAREIFRNAELLYEVFSRSDSRPVRRDLTVSEEDDSFVCAFDCLFNENIAETVEFTVTEE